MQSLSRSSVYHDALRRIRGLVHRAQRSRLREPLAMVLSTADQHGRPSARAVLLKSVDEYGFVFYTNLESRKARQLTRNPRAALCLLWDPLGRQVLVEGRVVRVSSREADAYWATRPRQSQLGAWASRQSRLLASRALLIQRVVVYAKGFARRPIPRPPCWGGYRLVPDRIELWARRPFRLHERRLYQRKGTRWTTHLLYP